MATMEKTIFFVDDDEDFLTVLSHRLKTSGYIVETTSSGLDALKKLTSFVPDLFLLDLQIPDLSGVEIAKNILKNEKLKNNFSI